MTAEDIYAEHVGRVLVEGDETLVWLSGPAGSVRLDASGAAALADALRACAQHPAVTG